MNKVNKEEIIGLNWWARERVRGFMTGLHKSPDFGFSLDFAQHRAYVPGDAPKFIDWTVLARQDKYLTKQFEAESNLRAYFLLDSSASMYGSVGSKWSYAVRQIALSAALLSKQRDALGLMDIREGEEVLFEAKNTDDALEQLLFHLANRCELSIGNGSMAGAAERLLSQIPPRSEVIVLTDVYHENLEGFTKQLGALVDAGHFVKLVLMISLKEELDVQFYGGSFVADSETGEKTMLSLKDTEGLPEFIQGQIQVVKEQSALYGIKYTVLYVEDNPLHSFRKIIAS